jgi:hypothetical protein
LKHRIGCSQRIQPGSALGALRHMGFDNAALVPIQLIIYVSRQIFPDQIARIILATAAVGETRRRHDGERTGRKARQDDVIRILRSDSVIMVEAGTV